MCLIPCNDDCMYQKDGYCELNAPAFITNNSEKGCVHYVKFNNTNNDKNYNNNQESVNYLKTQRLHEYF